MRNKLFVWRKNSDEKVELTLITCTNNKNKRLVVKCVAG